MEFNLFQGITDPKSKFFKGTTQQPTTPTPFFFSQVSQPVQPKPVQPIVQKPSMTLFSNEKRVYDEMISDGLSEEEAQSLVKKHRAQLAPDLKLNPIEQNVLRQMASDGLSSQESLQLLQKARNMKAEDVNKTFQDMHADEGVIEQSLKAIPRGIANTATQAWGGIGDATMNVMGGIFRGVNDLNKSVGSNDYSPELTQNIQNTTGSTGYFGDATGFAKGASTAGFNTVKAPVAIGLNTASELPGVQYGMQGLGKAIDTTGTYIGGKAGLSERDSRNITTTGLNILGLKTPLKSTADVLKNTKEAYTQGGVKAGAKTLLNQGVVGPTIDTVVTPVKAIGKGIQTIGTGVKKTGEWGYKKAFTPTTREAELLIRSEALGTKKPIVGSDSALKYNVVGTEKGVGVRSIRKADEIFKEKIAPVLEKSKEIHNTDTIFANLEKKILEEPALLRRKELMDGYSALKEEYAGLGRNNWSTKDLQNEKSSLDQFTPAKIFKGQDVAQGYNQVKSMLANEMRQIVRSDLEKSGLPNAREHYRDYANLRQLGEIGVKALTESKSRGGFGGFWNAVADKVLTPVETIGGLTVYKIGDMLEFKSVPGLKKFSDYLDMNGLKSINGEIIKTYDTPNSRGDSNPNSSTSNSKNTNGNSVNNSGLDMRSNSLIKKGVKKLIVPAVAGNQENKKKLKK